MNVFESLRLEFSHDWFYAREHGISKTAILRCYLVRFSTEVFFKNVLPGIPSLFLFSFTWDFALSIAIYVAYSFLLDAGIERQKWHVHLLCLSLGLVALTSNYGYLQLTGLATGSLVANLLLFQVRFKAQKVSKVIALMTLVVCWSKFLVQFTVGFHLWLGQHYEPLFISLNSASMHIASSLLGLSLLVLMTFSASVERLLGGMKLQSKLP